MNFILSPSPSPPDSDGIRYNALKTKKKVKTLTQNKRYFFHGQRAATEAAAELTKLAAVAGSSDFRLASGDVEWDKEPS